jgi:hypothetical protein
MDCPSLRVASRAVLQIGGAMNELAIDTSKTDVKAQDALYRANTLTIATPEEWARADAYCRGLYDLRKEIEADFAESEESARKAKKAATEALAAIVAQKESHTAPVLEAERVIKGKLMTFKNQEDAKRRKEQEEAQAKARKLAEDEQLRKAAALEAQGKKSQAEAVLAQPTKPQAVIIPPSLPKSQSVIKTVKKYKVVDENGVKREFCSPNAGQMWKAVQLYGKKAEEIVGGIEVWEEQI